MKMKSGVSLTIASTTAVARAALDPADVYPGQQRELDG